ncbi:MAG: carboxypeptidase regulatory-like domain-containing protein [Acidobacteria bacterium]|nr:carboxypeptidase regulatory-like domain-containing protein [Acidobacteriota bacterium]
MQVLAYVSDEMYVAIPDVIADFESVATGEVTVLRSSARGVFYGDLAAGAYRVTLAKPGFGSKTSTIDLPGAHFRLLSDGLIGYMWPKWAKSGEACEYRVHAVEQYQLALWRYGMRKEYVQMIAWMDEHGPQANRQILPDADFTQTGVKWNSDGYPAPPIITAPERSGLYYLWARTPSGRSFSFPWVVAPARPTAKIAVLASTNTWNAYNSYGGRSNYVNADKLPPKPVVNARQDLSRYHDRRAFGVWFPRDEDFAPLSFDRPEPNNHLLNDDGNPASPVQGRVQCGQCPGEWRLYAWLEREAFAYDLYAEAHLDEGALPLDEYRVLIIAVHPEYWTRQMYTRVKQWVFERGGRLMYLGGNGLNCEVTLAADSTMHCLSHLHSEHGEMGGKAPDGSMWESRMHRRFESEANLLGVVCSETGIMTSAPYRALDASHWSFAGTGLANGDTFGRETLHERVPGGASGHETDKRSASSPPGTQLLAKGLNPDDGGSEIVTFDTPSGGAVFSVGSITWVSALFPDAAVSRITRNVLERYTSEAR